MAHNRVSDCFSLRGAAAACLAFVSAGSSAEPWDYGVDIDVGAIVTDNIFLAPDGMEEDELIYMLRPEFYLETDGDRTQADIRYRPEAYWYRDNPDADNVYHVLDANLTTALIRDRLFVLLSGSNFQSIILPEGQFPTTNVPIHNNRVDSRVLRVQPYWRQNVGVANLLVEVGYVDTQFDSELLQSSNVTNARFGLDNHSQQQGVAWGLNYDYVRTEYEQSRPWEFNRVGADLGYWVSRTTRIFGAGGAETPIDSIEDLSANLDERFWEAGLQYKPSERLDFEAAAGERSYGSSFRLRFDYALKRGHTSLTYNEGPATRGQLPIGRRPIEDEDNLDNVLDRPGRSDRFLRRRAEWTTQLELAKSNMHLRLFGERREQRTTAEGDPLDDENYYGAAFRWDWNIGVNTNLGVGADYSRRDTGITDGTIRRYYINADLSFTERTSLVAQIMRSDQRGNLNSSSDYVENQLRLYLRVEI